MSTNYYLRTRIGGVTVSECHLAKHSTGFIFEAIGGEVPGFAVASWPALKGLLASTFRTDRDIPSIIGSSTNGVELVDEYGEQMHVGEFVRLVESTPQTLRSHHFDFLAGSANHSKTVTYGPPEIGKVWLDSDGFVWCGYEFS